MNKAQRLQKGLTVALITVLSLGIVSTLGKMLNDRYDWIDKTLELFKPSEETPIETKLINVVVQKEFEFTESEFFAGASESYLLQQSGGVSLYAYDFEINGFKFVYAAVNQQSATSFGYTSGGGLYSQFHFPSNYLKFAINGRNVPITYSADQNNLLNRFVYSVPNGLFTDSDDVFYFSYLSNFSIDPADVLTDDDGQYVLDVDGVTKLYLYQV